MTEKKTILIVEDEMEIAKPLKDLLTIKNFQVTHVMDGKEALETVINNPDFDLILLDEMLPSMKGSEILVRIKANSQSAKIPVIMMTSLKDNYHQIFALEEGVDDYINKPFDFSVLLARINSVLRKSQDSIKSLNIEIPPNADPEAITKKEKQILKLVIQGYNNNKIAEELFISESTVANHLKSIFSKLCVDTRTQAAILALKLNII